MERKNLHYLLGLLIVAVGMFVFGGVANFATTGYATSDSQVGNLSASIQTYMACTWSNPTLDADFGTMLNPGTDDINATENYALAGSGTGYNVTVSGLSTSNANITISGNDLVDGGNVIGIGNVTWQASLNANNDAAMVPAGSTPISGAENNIASDVNPTNTSHFRFWLDVPGTTVAGNYVGNYTIVCKEA